MSDAILSAGLESAGYVNGILKIVRSNELVKDSINSFKGAVDSIDRRLSTFGNVTGLSNIKRTLNELTTPATNFRHTMEQIEARIIRIGATLMVFKAVHLALSGIAAIAAEAIRYMSLMETAGLGISSSFLVVGQYVDKITGKVVGMNEAFKYSQQDSKDAVEQLRIANLNTIATLDELVQAYQIALPVAIRKGFKKDQVVEFTTAVMQMAGAIGQPFDQVSEEIRSLLGQSPITKNSRMAQILGLRPEDIRQFKNDGQALFAFLMEKMQPFKIAGVESQKTWKGLISNLKDVGKVGLEEAFGGTFTFIKGELASIFNKMVAIDEKTKQVKGWNPEFLERMKEIGKTITSLTQNIVGFAKWMATEFTLLGASIGTPLGLIGKFLIAYMALKSARGVRGLLEFGFTRTRDAIVSLMEAYKAKELWEERSLTRSQRMKAEEEQRIAQMVQRITLEKEEAALAVARNNRSVARATNTLADASTLRATLQNRVIDEAQDVAVLQRRSSRLLAFSQENVMKRESIALAIRQNQLEIERTGLLVEQYRMQVLQRGEALQSNLIAQENAAAQIAILEKEVVMATVRKQNAVQAIVLEREQLVANLEAIQKQIALDEIRKGNHNKILIMRAQERNYLIQLKELDQQRLVAEEALAVAQNKASIRLGLTDALNTQKALMAESVLLNKAYQDSKANLVGAENAHAAALERVEVLEAQKTRLEQQSVLMGTKLTQVTEALTVAKRTLAESEMELTAAVNAEAAALRQNARNVKNGIGEFVTSRDLIKKQMDFNNTYNSMSPTMKSITMFGLHTEALAMNTQMAQKATLAQKGLAAATKAGAAVFSFLGGTLGIATIAIMAGVWAWNKMSEAAGRAAKKVREASEEARNATKSFQDQIRDIKAKEELDKKLANAKKDPAKKLTDADYLNVALGANRNAYEAQRKTILEEERLIEEEKKKIRKGGGDVEVALAQGTASDIYNRQQALNKLKKDNEDMAKSAVALYKLRDQKEYESKGGMGGKNEITRMHDSTNDEKALLNEFLHFVSSYYKNLANEYKAGLDVIQEQLDISYRKAEISQTEYIERTGKNKINHLKSDKSLLEEQLAQENKAIEDWERKHQNSAKIFDQYKNQIKSPMDIEGIYNAPSVTGKVTQEFVDGMRNYRRTIKEMQELLKLITKRDNTASDIKVLGSQIEKQGLVNLDNANKVLEERIDKEQELQIEVLKTMGYEGVAYRLYLESDKYKRDVVKRDAEELAYAEKKLALITDMGSAEYDAAVKNLDLVKQTISARKTQVNLELMVKDLNQASLISAIELEKLNNKARNVEYAESKYDISPIEATKQRLEILKQEYAVKSNNLQYQENYTLAGKKKYEEMKQELTEINQKFRDQSDLLRRLSGADGFKALSEGFKDYAITAMNIADQIKSATVDNMKKMEDALTEFVTTGKTDFKSLVNSIISDLARIAINKSITGPLSELLGVGFSMFSSFLPGSRTASLTSTTSSNVGSWMSSGKYSLLGSYDSGTDYVPATGPYLLHRGEAVITEEENANRGLRTLSLTVPVTVNATGDVSKQIAAFKADMEEVAEQVVRRHF